MRKQREGSVTNISNYAVSYRIMPREIALHVNRALIRKHSTRFIRLHNLGVFKARWKQTRRAKEAELRDLGFKATLNSFQCYKQETMLKVVRVKHSMKRSKRYLSCIDFMLYVLCMACILQTFPYPETLMHQSKHANCSLFVTGACGHTRHPHSTRTRTSRRHYNPYVCVSKS